MTRAPRAIPLAMVLLLVSTPLPFATASHGHVDIGMDFGSVRALSDAGAPPEYGSYWVGPWMAVHGWGGLDNMLRGSAAAGVTPVVYWYYWGDSITPDCVENGCDARSKAEWVDMTATLASKVETYMGGRNVIVVLENEFNKGGITNVDYAPTFDGYLEARANELKAVAGVQIVLGYGSWGEDAWNRFPKAIAASDMIGFQLMRASTRDTEASYRASPDKIAQVLQTVGKLAPGKHAFLYDLALSSYPEVTHQTVQAETLKSILDRRGEFGANGLVGIVYRELRDNPSMGTHNYYGVAEQYWGFWDNQGARKPSWDVWLEANGATPAPAPAPATREVPGVIEAEGMLSTTGGRGSDGAASGTAYWNLWTDGEVSQQMSAKAGDHRFVIVARGTLAEDVGPRMEVRLDGQQVAAFDVTSAAWRDYVVEAPLPEGVSTLQVVFTNDKLTATEDRNLHVDVVRVEVVLKNAAPIARFFGNVEDLTLSVDASTSSDADGDALTYAWNFGDGNSGTGAKATHAYAQAGSYTVTLTVNDGKDRSTAQQAVTATRPNAAPSASFSVSGRDLGWSFDASASSDADGDVLTYAWNFGDGTTATGVTAAHGYAQAGDYTVTLEVSDGTSSKSAQKTVTTTKPNAAPSASFGVSGRDLGWSFDASASSDADGDALTYAWSFGDGKTATGVMVSHSYAQAGGYTVTLTVSDGRESATTTRTVTATEPNQAPIATFAVSGRDLSFTFDASASSDADGDRLTYVWDFGDGSTGSGVTETHSYQQPGEYAVKLQVLDGRGGVSEDVRIVEPALPAPSAAEPASQLQEAEAFEAKDTGGAFDDVDASNQAGWLLWSNGGMHQAFAPGEGTFRVTVVAKGDYAAGWPTMELRADGAVVATWTVGTATWASYTADVAFRPGVARTLSVHFTNDHLSTDGDRNLRVDVVRLAPPPAAQNIKIEAEAFASRPTGTLTDDKIASGGQAWSMWNTGAISTTASTQAATYAVEVVARGEHARGWPEMELRLNGAPVARWTVSSTSWMSYYANVVVPEGEETDLSIHFLNDHYNNKRKEDRNLHVDVLRLTAK